MNTPARAPVDLALPARRPAAHTRSAAIVAGAPIPELAIVPFHAGLIRA